jgi:hypothetical protein
MVLPRFDVEKCKKCQWRIETLCDPANVDKTVPDFKNCPNRPQVKPKREEKKKWEQSSLNLGIK